MAETREFVRGDVERTRNVAALQNHDVLDDASGDDDRSPGPISAIDVPTLVIHGTADPMFPLAHGEALADEITGATLLTLEGAGHGVDRRDRETVAAAILDHSDPSARLRKA